MIEPGHTGGRMLAICACTCVLCLRVSAIATPPHVYPACLRCVASNLAGHDALCGRGTAVKRSFPGSAHAHTMYQMSTHTPPTIVYVRDGSSQALTRDEADKLGEMLSCPRDNNLPYGWRMSLGQHGVRVPVSHEQATIAKIRELRSSGWGRVRITNYLNELGYRPRGRRGATKWHEKTVQVIIDRIDAEQRAYTD